MTCTNNVVRVTLFKVAVAWCVIIHIWGFLGWFILYHRSCFYENITTYVSIIIFSSTLCIYTCAFAASAEIFANTWLYFSKPYEKLVKISPEDELSAEYVPEINFNSSDSEEYRMIYNNPHTSEDNLYQHRCSNARDNPGSDYYDSCCHTDTDDQHTQSKTYTPFEDFIKK